MASVRVFLALWCVAGCVNAYVLPKRSARAVRSVRVTMNDPMKDGMSDPEAKGFAYDVLEPIYGKRGLCRAGMLHR